MSIQSFPFVQIEDIDSNRLSLSARSAHFEVEPVTISLCVSIGSQIHVKVSFTCLNNRV